MKKLNLISLEKDVFKKDSLEDCQMQSIRGGGVCACRHQGTRRSQGASRGEVKDYLDLIFTPAK